MIIHKRKILIIEDNELNRDILAAMLEDEYQLYMAGDGVKGLQLMHEHCQDLSVVLLDIQMPLMNGYEVLRTVCGDEKLKEIPVIVTTSSNRLEEEELCLRLGATDFIAKPYNPNIVRCRIENIIRLQEKTATLTAVEIDNVTGAYTRGAFIHYASQMLKTNPDVDFTLILTDIIGFQQYVDLYGEGANRLLRKEVEALRKRVCSMSIFGQFSRDKFLWMMPTVGSDMPIREKKDRYEIATRRLSSIVGAPVRIGVSEHVNHHRSITEDIARANKALKSIPMGHSVAFVNDELIDHMRRTEVLTREMSDCLKNHQLEIYLQPKHHSVSGKLLGAEVLLRWNHPILGIIPSGEFIPIFEQTGFIAEADAFAWKEACRVLREMQDKGLPGIPMSVNTTRIDFEKPEFDRCLFEPLQTYHVDPFLLHIEVTERIFSDLRDDSIELLQHCRRLGISVELDDFGTGYSSLYSLAELPIDIVKFDQSFVRNLNNQRQIDVMNGCVNLVKRLKLKSVAEGVEDERSRQQIINMGIDMIQGYYFARPMSVSDFEAYVRRSEVMSREEYLEMGYDPHMAELERLRRLAEEDPLTGLNNRYRLYNNIDVRIASRKPFTLVLLDVDNFKAINDTFGHLVGDRVLLGVANSMKKLFPNCELIRLGGDEFVIIFDGQMGQQQMLTEMQAFFHEIQNLRIEGMVDSSTSITTKTHNNVSVSAGCALYRGDAAVSFEQLYTQADKSLYISKHTIGCCINY